MTWDLAYLIFLVVLLAYFINALYRRRQGAPQRRWEDDYHAPARGRETPESNQRWQGKQENWGQAIENAETELKSAKASLQAAQQLEERDYQTFADETTRKSDAMRVLNAQRNRKVHLITRKGAAYSGEVVTLTAEQVMLRGTDGQVQGVALAEIEKFAPG